MERTVKLKYSGIYFAVLNIVITANKILNGHFKKGRTPL